MTRDDCDHHDCESDCRNNHHALIRCIIYTIVILISILGLTILLTWLILRPTKPEFILQDATVSSFNLTQSNILTTTFQVTISTRNPNEKIGIYYERANVYASYRNQPITPSTNLPPTYLGHKDNVMWSPYLFGHYTPINMYLGTLLRQDQIAGIVLINVKIDGIMKWKVGSWVSGKYQLNVNCHAYVIFGNNNDSSVGGGNNSVGVIIYDPSDKFHLSSKCDVDV